MKKTAFLAAVAAVACATPAAANGYLGLRYNDGSIDSGATQDVTAWQGEGEVGWNTGAGNWGGQIGGQYGNADVSFGSTDFYTLNGHMYYQGDGWRAGGVVTYGNIEDADYSEWSYGAEGSFDVGPDTSLFASGVLGSIDTGGSDTDAWSVDFGVGHYFSDNFRLAGNVGWGNLKDLDFDLTTYGINAEYQFSGAPISITGGWNRFEVDGFLSGDADYFSVGARWNFGGGTLRERNAATPFNANGIYGSRIYGVAAFN